MTFYEQMVSHFLLCWEKRRDLKCTNLWNATAKEGSLLWILWPDRKCMLVSFGVYL